MLKKFAGVAALAMLMSLPLAAQADGRGRGHGGWGGGGPTYNAPEIDGGGLVLAMTLLTGVVGLVRRYKAK